MDSYSNIISKATKGNVEKMRDELRALEKNDFYLATSLYLDTIVANDDSLYNEIYKAIFTLPLEANRAVLSMMSGGRLIRLSPQNLAMAISLIHDNKIEERALYDKSFLNGLAKKIKRQGYEAKDLKLALDTLCLSYPDASYKLFSFLKANSKKTIYLEEYFKKFFLRAVKNKNKRLAINSVSMLFNMCSLNETDTLREALNEAREIDTSIEIHELIIYMLIVAYGYDGSAEERAIILEADTDEFRFDSDKELIYLSFLKERLGYYLSHSLFKYASLVAIEAKNLSLGGSNAASAIINDMDEMSKKAIISYNNGSIQKLFENLHETTYSLSFDINRLDLLREGNTVYLIKDKKYECECEFIKFYSDKNIVILSLKLPIFNGSSELAFKREKDGLHYLGTLENLLDNLDDENYDIDDFYLALDEEE